MPVKESLEVKELRIQHFPMYLHKKIKAYINRVGDRERRDLNKQTAVIELVDKALKNITID